MSYYNQEETNKRIAAVQAILEKKNLDAALVYFDELNVANGWYLTGWCGQFEKGSVFVPRKGEPWLLGGPESEPFAIQSSAIKKIRCFPVFMVPEEEYPNAHIIGFDDLYKEMSAAGMPLKRIGLVGTAALPHQVYLDFQKGFAGVELVDITGDYEAMRAYKSEWERENMVKAVGLCDLAYDAMKANIRPGAFEYEVAAAGEVALNMRTAGILCMFAALPLVGAASHVFHPDEPGKTVEWSADVRVRALQETAYTYYLKGPLAQYDSIPLVPCAENEYRWSRKMDDVPIEEATADRTYYTVCSEFVRGVYVNALDVHLLTEEPVSYNLIFKSPPETIVYRWDEKTSKESKPEAFAKLLELIEPGDIISGSRFPDGGGHVMMYFGRIDGRRMIIHSSGSKYDFSTGRDRIEERGTVRFTDLDQSFYKSSDDYNSLTDPNFVKYPRFILLRPLKAAGVKATPSGLARAAHPRFRYDRRVQGGVYGAVRTGSFLSYSVTIENHSYKSYPVPVREKIPAGTEFVNADEGGRLVGDTIVWDVELGPGMSRTLRWKLKVNLRPGEKVVANEGSAAGIPSNRLVTEVTDEANVSEIAGWYGGRKNLRGTPAERLREPRSQDLGEYDYVLAVKDISRPKQVETLVKGDDEAKFTALLSYDWFQAYRGTEPKMPGAYKFNRRSKLAGFSFRRGFEPASGCAMKDVGEEKPIHICWETLSNGAVKVEHSSPTNWEVFVRAYPGDVTRYGFRIVKPRFGKDDPMPELKLPEGWRIAEGEDLSGVNIREAFITIEKNGLKLPPPDITVAWPGVGVKGVYGATNVVIDAEGARFTARDAKPPTMIRTQIGRKGCLSVTQMHHIDGMQAGPYRNVPFPDREIAAVDNFVYALREGFRFLGFEKDDALPKGVRVWLCGFDSNFPNGHTDFPAHFHIGTACPGGGEVNHFYPDHETGRIVSNCYQDFENARNLWDEALIFHPGDEFAVHDAEERPVFLVKLIDGGYGLEVSMPDRRRGFAVRGERPCEKVEVYGRDESGERFLGSVSVKDDPIAGTITTPDGVIHYNPDTGDKL